MNRGSIFAHNEILLQEERIDTALKSYESLTLEEISEYNRENLKVGDSIITILKTTQGIKRYHKVIEALYVNTLLFTDGTTNSYTNVRLINPDILL